MSRSGRRRFTYVMGVKAASHVALTTTHADAAAILPAPFIDLPNSKTSYRGARVTAEQMKEMQWLRPKLAAQIPFVERRADGHLRHAAFVGLRSDKKAMAVRRDG